MKVDEITNRFITEAYGDEKLQELISLYQEALVLTGINSQDILSQIFDYLDNKLQAELRLNLN